MRDLLIGVYQDLPTCRRITDHGGRSPVVVVVMTAGAKGRMPLLVLRKFWRWLERVCCPSLGDEVPSVCAWLIPFSPLYRRLQDPSHIEWWATPRRWIRSSRRSRENKGAPRRSRVQISTHQIAARQFVRISQPLLGLLKNCTRPSHYYVCGSWTVETCTVLVMLDRKDDISHHRKRMMNGGKRKPGFSSKPSRLDQKLLHHLSRFYSDR